MTPIDVRVDWEGIKRSLAVLHRESPTFLSMALIIGGAASWFYRIQLQKASDVDFFESAESKANNEVWFSKDIDFTGVFRADAYDLLPALIRKDSEGRSYLSAEGVRIGFAQVGVTFDPEEAFRNARLGQIEVDGKTVKFWVMDPITLYREKQALAQKRNQLNDRLHLATLSELLALEFVNNCGWLVSDQNGDISRKRAAINFISAMRERASEILDDARVIRRTKEFAKVNSEEGRLVRSVLTGGSV